MAALVLGIFALLSSFIVVGGLLGVVAIILGIVGRGRVKRGEANNGGMALAGIILGVLSLLVSAAILIGGVALFDKAGGGDLVRCLEDAGQDQAAIDQCGRDVEERLNN